jgi:hypothetical protein
MRGAVHKEGVHRVHESLYSHGTTHLLRAFETLLSASKCQEVLAQD